MYTIADIERELKELDVRKRELEALYQQKCDSLVREAIEQSAQEKKVKRMGTSPNCIIIKASDLCGKPWNVEFHDWFASQKVLMEYLEKKPSAVWRETIVELSTKSKNGVAYIPKTIRGPYFSTKTTIPISNDFLKAILAKLS